MSRIGHFLTVSLERLRGMQLATGELPAVQFTPNGESYYAPSPLLSTIADDALSTLDRRSVRFVGRVRDLVPTSFFRTVASLRWGLRLHIAAQEEADGTWQLHGRAGARAADVATTACAAAALMPNVRWRVSRPDRRHIQALRRLATAREWTPHEAVHALRYLSLTGADTRSLAVRVLRDVETQPVTTAYAYAVARTWQQCGLAGLERVAAHLVPNISVPEPRLARAMAVQALLDLGVSGPPLNTFVWYALSDPTPPWQWPADPHDETQVGSAPVALALTLANVARIAATGGGEER